MADKTVHVMPDGVEDFRKETFYIKLQSKIIRLRKDWEVYFAHAPKHEKYALCLRIRNRIDDLFEMVVVCRKKYWNKTSLTKLDLIHEQLRADSRLYYELGLFEFHRERLPDVSEEMPWQNRAMRRFTNVNVQTDEIGRMIGGLIKASRISQSCAEDLADSESQ